MQIVPVNLPPVVPSALPAQTITNVLPHIQAQAVAPISAQAVSSTKPVEKGQSVHPKDETDEEDDREGAAQKHGRAGQPSADGSRGHSVNISV